MLLGAEGERRRAGRRCRKLRFMRNGVFRPWREPGQSHNGRDMRYRTRLQERQRSEMAEAAAVLGRMLPMLKGERGCLRANHGAQKQ
jgi:hypothetical protein